MTYLKLEEGAEFPPAQFCIDDAIVADYLKAVGENAALYSVTGVVPPMIIAGRVIGSLGIGTVIPAGVIHLSQQLDFLKAIHTGITLECRPRVEKVAERGRLTMISVDMPVYDAAGEKVLGGKLGFALPLEAKA